MDVLHEPGCVRYVPQVAVCAVLRLLADSGSCLCITSVRKGRAVAYKVLN